mmetsp:Transcript_6853/g.10016  ORF Transcript_6853/g.10016 Transcript_6853/m.10016 type:complete len:275 (+) Transcript_6853:70-894(+)
MVQVNEFRIQMPFTPEEFRIGQLYAIAEMSEEQSSADEGVEILKNEPFENKTLGKGQYTHKIYHAGDRLPAVFKPFIPSKMLDFHEEAWNAFPYCKTIVTCPYFGKKFGMSIISQHKLGAHDEADDEENPLNLKPEVLKKRKIKYLDIANDKLVDKYDEKEDPKKIKLDKTEPNRGPLTDDGKWHKNEKTVMTCYKVVTVKCTLIPVGVKAIEKKILEMQSKIFHAVHRKLYCSANRWINLSMEDVRAKEAEIQAKMKELYKDSKKGSTTSKKK